MEEEAVDAHSQLSGRHILIVEDELPLAMDMEDLLLEVGCDVIGTVPTVQGALAILRHQRPEAVLLDLNLGEDSKASTAEELNRRCIPFLIVSGYGRMREKEPALCNVPLVQKSWNRSELLDSLRDVLDETSSTTG
ncbi:response regulator [Rhizorhapis sp. SPR117]|uniref:response regulator n=1 Tax=Rhizorhapis sp. SPR117 TaxID=2912611 RepID=UPI001F027B8A|nr:response regulator [Rhizorhapis sp. SPR117]